MSKLNIESTSEGSIAKFNGGLTIIKGNICVIPEGKEVKTPLEAEEYITMALIQNPNPNKNQDNVR